MNEERITKDNQNKNYTYQHVDAQNDQQIDIVNNLVKSEDQNNQNEQRNKIKQPIDETIKASLKITEQ